MRWPSTELVAATEELCKGQSSAARTRHTLLKIEKSQQRAGWGRPVTLFRVERHPHKGFVAARVDQQITRLLRQSAARMNDDIGQALQYLVHLVIQAREEMEKLGDVLPGTDLFGGVRVGHRVDGFALCVEVTAYDEYEHPPKGFSDARLVQFVARDGFSWNVVRLRDQQPAVVAAGLEDEAEILGQTANALERLISAVSPAPFPKRDSLPQRGGSR